MEKLDQKQLEKVMEENRLALNSIVASYESVAKIQLYPNEFEKTPKKSIKRYLSATSFSNGQSSDNQ
jgi:long-chain acyl-CoA synthetase